MSGDEVHGEASDRDNAYLRRPFDQAANEALSVAWLCNKLAAHCEAGLDKWLRTVAMYLVSRQAFGAAASPSYWKFHSVIENATLIAPIGLHNLLDRIYQFHLGTHDHSSSVQELAVYLVERHGENPILINGLLRHISELPWQFSHGVSADVAKAAQATLQAGEINLTMEIVFEAVMSRCLLV